MAIQESSVEVRDDRSLTIVRALVEHGLLRGADAAEAARLVERSLQEQVVERTPVRRRLVELSAYLGAVLVVSAAAVLLFEQWVSLGRTVQVLTLAGIAVLLAGCGVLVGRGAGLARMRAGAEPARRLLVSVFLVAASVSAGGAVGLQVDRLYTGGESTPVLAGLTTVLLLGVLGYRFVRSLLAQALLAATACLLVPAVLDQLGEVRAWSTGVLVLAIGLLWLLLAERRVWTEVGSARVFGAGLAVVGAQVLVVDDPTTAWIGYLALAAVAAAGLTAYVLRPAWPYLGAGVVALTVLIPQALLDWTDEAIGPAGALLVGGLTLVTASLVGFRLGARTVVDVRD